MNQSETNYYYGYAELGQPGNSKVNRTR